MRDWLPLIVLAAVVAGGVYFGRPEPPPAEFELLWRATREECGPYKSGGGLEEMMRIAGCEERVCNRWHDVCERMEWWRETRAAEREAREESARD